MNQLSQMPLTPHEKYLLNGFTSGKVDEEEVEFLRNEN